MLQTAKTDFHWQGFANCKLKRLFRIRRENKGNSSNCYQRRQLRPVSTIKGVLFTSVDLYQNTPNMPTPPTLSTPQHSCARVNPPNISHLSPLPSTISPVPTFILPPPCSHPEQVLPHNLNSAMSHNSSTSPLTTSSHSAMFDRSTLVSTLPSPRVSITEICHCSFIPTVGHDNNGTSICDSDRKLKCTRKHSASEKSPRPLHHTFPLCSPVNNIPTLQLPLSVSDAYCSPYNNHKPQTQHSALSSPTTSTHIDDVASLILPSSLPSISDEISALCLRSAVWKE